MAESELMCAPRGRKARPPRDCETDGCDGVGRSNITIDGAKIFVCSKCRSRHDRRSKNICDVRGCSGVVRIGTNRPNRWCRSHEDLYMTSNPDEAASTIRYLGSEIESIGNGCWQYVGRDNREAGTTRPVIWNDGLRYYVSRYLYVHFHGPHKGGRELHHRCGNSWCVRPGHLDPITPKANMRIERKVWTWMRVLDKWLVKANPTQPTNPAKAAELSEFTAGLRQAPERRGQGFTLAQLFRRGRAQPSPLRHRN